MRRDSRGATAVEIALIMVPFITLLFCIIQTGVYFMAQSALDTGVMRTAETIRQSMVAAAASYVAPTAAALKTSVLTNGNVMIGSGGLVLELQPLTTLSAATVGIADNTVNIGSSGTILVMRARVPVMSFAAPMGNLSATSSVIIRRPF